jgi:hypothetical protein
MVPVAAPAVIINEKRPVARSILASKLLPWKTLLRKIAIGEALLT